MVRFVSNFLAATLGKVEVQTLPSVINSVAELSILFTPLSEIPTGGSLELTLPSTTSITQGVIACTIVEPAGIAVTCTATGSLVVAVLGATLPKSFT
jgi:hypothetical protein